MTIDDESSIYVGGLPYDVNEDTLRRVFYVYGAVVAVKIINDVGAKCYGFVTFANPRSAMQAIKEMDGKTIRGRVVRVNEVRTRGARPNGYRDSYRHGREMSTDGDRLHDRYSHRDRSQDLNKDRERSDDDTKDHYVEGERYRDYNRHMADLEHDDGRKRERDWERESDQGIDQQRRKRERESDHAIEQQRRKLEHDWERESNHDIEQQRNNGHHRNGENDKDRHFPLLNRSEDHGDREFSSESFNDDQDEVKTKVDVSKLKLGELQKEISQMEDLAAAKRESLSKLKEKYQRLEDSLISARKLTSHRHNLLLKLRKCYLQTRDFHEKFKKSEQDLQRIVDSTKEELDTVADA